MTVDTLPHRPTDTDLSLDEYAAGLRQWLRAEFGDRAITGHRTTEQTVESDAGTMAKLHAAGWSRYGWPHDVGGLGGDARYRAVLYDLVGAAGVPIPHHVISLETLGPALVQFARHLAARWLPDALTGRELWSQGFSEPEAGSDLAALRCTAVRRDTPDGPGLVINGQKTWTTLGHVSQRIAVLCRTGALRDRHRGLSLVMVDLDTPGVECRPIRMANGRNEFSEVFFADAWVPMDRLVGELNQGWAVAMYLLQFERGMYAWQRQAWLLSRIRALRHRLAGAPREHAELLGDAHLSVLALRARTAETVRALAREDDVGPEASVDKVLLAHAEQTVLDCARVLLGPSLDLDGDDDAEGWRADWFYTRAASVYGGAGEIQRSILADRVLNLPREPR